MSNIIVIFAKKRISTKLSNSTDNLIMKAHEMEIVKDATLVLRQGEKSNEFIIDDPSGENMYLTFELRYIKDNEQGITQIKATDTQHANLIIDTKPNAIVEPMEYIKLGTYDDGTPLYLRFVVQPQIAQSGQHNVIVMFLKEKKTKNGSVSE